MRNILLFCVLVWTGCLEKPKDAETVLVVASAEAVRNSNEPPPPPPSPYSYYGCFNFIFDTSGTIYFYQNFYDKDKPPVRVIDFDSDAPIFIDLNPDKIIVIPDNQVGAFFESNISPADPVYKSVRVVGMADTIKSESLPSLMNKLTDTANHIYHSVRRATLEERTVLDYKKRQKFYTPDKISWDSTKIWFDRRRRE